MIESINKALSDRDAPIKEKHVRKLLIGSYQAESGEPFWLNIPQIRLKENHIVCWKFCHVLHKMLRDGHRQVLPSSHERRQVLLDCGNMWRHVEDGYGQLIFKYCTLLYNRISFLMNNPEFPNDLKVSNDQLDNICNNDINIFFNLSCEIFDALDDILRLQELVLSTLDLKKLNSMTNSGQCHLAPLVACIQDSSLLYDYSVKILFKLHGCLPPETLEGHRDRFVCQHRILRKFYSNASNLQYFKTLIQIPHLSSRSPNFLIASDLQQHVTPQAVLISTPDRDSPDTMSTISRQIDTHQNDSQLLVNISDDVITDDVDSNATPQSHVAHVNESVEDSMSNTMNSFDTNFQDQSSSSSIGYWREKSEELTRKVGELESVIDDLRSELELEKVTSTSEKESLLSKLESVEKSLDDNSKAHEIELGKLRDELKNHQLNFKYQLNSTKTALDKMEEECKRAKHDNEISQGAMKKLVKDLSDLKNENAQLRQQCGKFSSTERTSDKLEVEELQKKVQELSLQLNQQENQSQEWIKERDQLMSTKQRLEQQLDTKQEDLLVAEMNETDKIIKDATQRIEEMSQKSRKMETGIKLQVNEKISEVCSNLMKAVRNLIVQSRLLQREVVGADQNSSKSSEFYQRNSSWTEGLISAANVVAMAAKALVDSADRAMSGQAKYSELAAAANEIAAATTQLVVASRVKANKDSEKLKILTSVAKQVNQCTGNVVDTARVCAEMIEQEVDKIDFSSLSLHQTKKLEMETQVKLLELEDRLSKERIKLGILRRQHYEQEDAQAASANKANA